MVPLAQKSLDKVLKLLFLSAEGAVRGQTERLARALATPPFTPLQPLTPMGPPLSFFGTRLSVEQAPLHTQSPTISQILEVATPNPLLTKVDFINLLPSADQALFQTAKLPNGRLEFEVVRSRSARSLRFANAYYLVFPNAEEACVYWCEASGAVLTGRDLQMRFATLTECRLQLHSPVLGAVPWPLSVYLPELGDNAGAINAGGAGGAAGALNALNATNTSNATNATHTTSATHTPGIPRTHCVLVQNLPFNVTIEGIRNTLWDYTFHNTSQALLALSNPLVEPVEMVYQKRSTNTNVWLLRFADEANATRFIRSYNGTRWYANNNIALNSFFKLGAGTTQFATEHHESRYSQPLVCEAL